MKNITENIWNICRDQNDKDGVDVVVTEAEHASMKIWYGEESRQVYLPDLQSVTYKHLAESKRNALNAAYAALARHYDSMNYHKHHTPSEIYGNA